MNEVTPGELVTIAVVDSRRRLPVGKTPAQVGDRYLVYVQSDGSILLRPADASTSKETPDA